MKVFLLSLAVKAVLIVGVGAALLFVANKEIDRRVHNRLGLAIKWELHKQDREWHRLTLHQQRQMPVIKDGVDRSHGWYWQTNDKHEYRLLQK